MVQILYGEKEITRGLIIEGRTYARVADLLDGLGHAYQWDGEDPTIAISRGIGLGTGINDIQLTANFNLTEFACRHCGAVKIDPALVTRLQQLRDRVGRPIIITSGYRCEAHNRAVGGATDSQHLLGKAADIQVEGMAPDTLAAHAEAIGFGGIGIYSNFVHVDTRAGRVRWRG